MKPCNNIHIVSSSYTLAHCPAYTLEIQGNQTTRDLYFMFTHIHIPDESFFQVVRQIRAIGPDPATQSLFASFKPLALHTNSDGHETLARKHFRASRLKQV